jgi:hypothetical protein
MDSDSSQQRVGVGVGVAAAMAMDIWLRGSGTLVPARPTANPFTCSIPPLSFPSPFLPRAGFLKCDSEVVVIPYY